MSELSTAHLEAETKERFVNDFWTSLPTERQFEILEAKYGKDFINEEFQDWIQEQDHEN